MQKTTHLSFCLFLVAVMFKLAYPITEFSYAVLGTLIPDLDIFFMHRKLLHNFLALTIFSLIFIFVGVSKAGVLFFIIGYIGHLLMDSLTEMGVMPLYPFDSETKFEGGMVTGSFLDNAVGMLFFILAIIIFLSTVINIF